MHRIVLDHSLQPADLSFVVDVAGGISGTLRLLGNVLDRQVLVTGASGGVGGLQVQPAPLSLYDFIGHENVTIHTYFSYAADASRDADDLASLLRLVEQGHLTSTIAGTWALEDAGTAVRQLAGGGTRGKIVLVHGDHTTATKGA